MAEVANAQSNENIGQKAEQLKTQFGSLGKALVAGAFFIGIILVITGLIKLKAASENPNQAKYSDGLWRLAVGAGLIAIPAVTGILGASLGLGETKSITAAGGESF
jgi:hypothetical protein